MIRDAIRRGNAVASQNEKSIVEIFLEKGFGQTHSARTSRRVGVALAFLGNRGAR